MGLLALETSKFNRIPLLFESQKERRSFFWRQIHNEERMESVRGGGDSDQKWKSLVRRVGWFEREHA